MYILRLLIQEAFKLYINLLNKLYSEELISKSLLNSVKYYNEKGAAYFKYLYVQQIFLKKELIVL